MGTIKGMHVSWPPVGWKQFGQILKPNGQAIAKDARAARVIGLAYSIDSTPVFHIQNNCYVHDIRIDGWEYTIQNESSEYPVLSFEIMDRYDPQKPREFYISKIKTMACSVPNGERSAQRAVMAGLFFIKQVSAGQVPDVERVLKIYKLHPSQSRIYDVDSVHNETLCHGAVSNEYIRRKNWNDG